MSNPFDRYDPPAAGANPFDRYDEKPKQAMAPKSEKSTARRLLEGAALGISDIGNTVLNVATSPLAALSPTVAQWNRTRNADFDALTEENKDSTAFTVGRVGGNIAGTLPVGGALGAGVRAAAPALARAGVSAPVSGALANSLASGGFNVGSSNLPAWAIMALRSAGGAGAGGASAALANPDDVGAGAAIGGFLPGFTRAMGVAGAKTRGAVERTAENLMQSALKPTIKQLQTGEAATAVRTLLDHGIMPNGKGVGKLQGLIEDLNNQIGTRIANSTASIDKAKVLTRLDDTKRTFGNQVSPTSDLAAIDRVGDDFLSHPIYPGTNLPVQAAQLLKQGTYKTLAKKYGQLGGAETEAQKGLARGLKEEIADAVPEIAGLNKAEAKLITTLKVAERRALMELNKNPVGLSALAQNPAMALAFMADRSATFKALAARMVNSSAGAAGGAGAALDAGFSNPLLRNAATLSVASGQRE